MTCLYGVCPIGKDELGMTEDKQGSGPRRRTPPGAAPGTLIADPAATGTSIGLIAYGDDQFVERQDVTIEDVRAAKGSTPILWVNVDGLANIDVIEQLGEIFDLHDLALEDVIDARQRPKAEEYPDHVFIVTRMPVAGHRIETEQMSMFVGSDFVLTFQERPADCFEPVRQRLRQRKGRIRQTAKDFLAYALIDAVIDAYFPVLERYGEHLEKLEDAVVTRPTPVLIEQVHATKRDLLNLRRAIWPHRDMVNALIRDETPLVTEQTRIYLRDCYDHTIQLMEFVETYREVVSALVEVYLSSMSTRLNDIMKVLTVIATIFIPLNFIASLYGMNFDRSVSPWNMPELGWRFGYPFALAIMALSAILLVVYFLRNRWITPMWRRSDGRRGRRF
jgi:magnesium transporter